MLAPERLERVSGFGLASHADGYVYRPASTDELAQAFADARAAGRRVVLRGAGRSYGDASLAPEAVVVDVSRMDRVLSWDRGEGVLVAEGGLTVEGVWRRTLEDGWWPHVVSGTMRPTLAGALGMNIHGKNAFRAGTLGEHVRALDVLLPTGGTRTLTPADDDFFAVVSGAGLLGAITRVELQLKRVKSGDLRVLPLSCPGWDAQFEAFERFGDDADYMVSWVDAFASGRRAGRGLFHAAWYTDEPDPHPRSLRPDHQDLPDAILGFFPKAAVWRVLKALNRRFAMRALNAAKHRAGATLGNGMPHLQSLVGFSFLLDYVPHWRNAYLPGGFIQYQSFVPRENAPRVFARQLELQRETGLESFLAVLKRHRPDRFLLSHGVDGYSLALDFKVTRANWPRLQALCWKMNDLVLESGGRFYLAKDSTLRPADVRAYLGDATLTRFREAKARFDPEGLLTSALAVRTGLLEASEDPTLDRP